MKVYSGFDQRSALQVRFVAYLERPIEVVVPQREEEQCLRREFGRKRNLWNGEL